MPVKAVDVSSEYAKNKDLKKEDVETLRQWMEKQPHLPTISELELVLFLHSCYNRVEPTKTTIDTFYTTKAHFTDVFANRDPNLQRNIEAMDCGLFAQLPKRTPEGYRVLFFTWMDGDPAKFVAIDQMKMFDMGVRLWLREDGTAEGLIFVVDVKKLTLGHVARIGIISLKNFFGYLQDALPVRLKGMHFVNAGGAAEKLMSLCKPFIKAELNEMLHLHADISESVYKVVPKECLPEDYGGSADSFAKIHEATKKKILDNAEYFIEDEKYIADESKRVGKSTNFIQASYGLDGSFKKLELD